MQYFKDMTEIQQMILVILGVLVFATTLFLDLEENEARAAGRRTHDAHQIVVDNGGDNYY